MSASQQTITPSKRELFERPELLLNEPRLMAELAKPITPENFSNLITANFFVALDAYDRRLTRQSFEELLVDAFNFQNRMVRISELNGMLEKMEEGRGFSTTEIKSEVARHMAQANSYKAKLGSVLRLFGEMRSAEDPVS